MVAWKVTLFPAPLEQAILAMILLLHILPKASRMQLIRLECFDGLNQIAGGCNGKSRQTAVFFSYILGTSHDLWLVGNFDLEVMYDYLKHAKKKTLLDAEGRTLDPSPRNKPNFHAHRLSFLKRMGFAMVCFKFWMEHLKLIVGFSDFRVDTHQYHTNAHQRQGSHFGRRVGQMPRQVLCKKLENHPCHISSEDIYSTVVYIYDHIRISYVYVYIYNKWAWINTYITPDFFKHP